MRGLVGASGAKRLCARGRHRGASVRPLNFTVRRRWSSACTVPQQFTLTVV